MSFKILQGDCLTELKKIPDASVQLIFTSPPYADARKKIYFGIHPDQYVEWFLDRSVEFKRVLKPTGTFVLNIKERIVDGERHPYVIDLITALRKRQEWLFTEEWIWAKKNCTPGKWPNRFRDSWERILQFNLRHKFDMYQDAVRVPIGSWAKNRLENLSEKDRVRDLSSTGSGFGKNVSNWVGRDTVYPTNVLHLATECGYQGHPATFPVALPEFFVKLFTLSDDVVLDPFSGSGTTGIATLRLNRKYLGVEIVEKYVVLSNERLLNDLYVFQKIDKLKGKD